MGIETSENCQKETEEFPSEGLQMKSRPEVQARLM